MWVSGRSLIFLLPTGRAASQSEMSLLGPTLSQRMVIAPTPVPNRWVCSAIPAGTIWVTGGPKRVTTIGSPALRTRSKTARQVALNLESRFPAKTTPSTTKHSTNTDHGLIMVHFRRRVCSLLPPVINRCGDRCCGFYGSSSPSEAPPSSSDNGFLGSIAGRPAFLSSPFRSRMFFSRMALQRRCRAAELPANSL